MDIQLPNGYHEAALITSITEPVMFFNLAKTWHPDITDTELFARTSGAWRCWGPRRDKAEFALAVYRGFVLAVYEIDGWRERREGDLDWQDDLGQPKPRLVFECSHAPRNSDKMSQLVGRSVQPILDISNNPQWAFRYINC